MANCVENPSPCTGCGVCQSICPTKAISMKLNAEGFWTAEMDSVKCVHCQKCVNVCPKFTDKFPASAAFETLPLYAAHSKSKQELKTSSSGGIATEITKWAFENGYKVAGVIYNYQRQCAETVIARTQEEAEAFKGSKYLQSDSACAFEQILKSKEKLVVFGTPCQIAALHLAATLFNKRNDLILVDFFCHGVPSYLLWNAFVAQQPQQIKQIRFRHKKYGWHNYTMQINGHLLPQHKNLFYSLFFSDLLLGPQCYACQSRRSFAFADIRLGDFWGSAFDWQEDGVSVVCVITQKGQNLLRNIQNTLQFKKTTAAHELCRKNQQSFHLTPLSIYSRQLILDALKEGNISQALQLYYETQSIRQQIIKYIKEASPHFIKKILRYFYQKKKKKKQ